MFQNSYQNGTYFDLYDPKSILKVSLASQDKAKNLYKISNVHGNNKVFDKQLKTYVLQFSSSTARISFPKEEKKDLYLIQQYLVLQIYFFPQMSWNIQLVVSDLTKTKRRIILSSSCHKVEIKPFFVKVPCVVKEGVWTNLGVDLFSFIDAFKGQTYRSLDSIYITGHFKLRRLYTSNTRPMEDQYIDEHQQQSQISFLPKNFYFPPEIPYTTKVLTYEGQTMDLTIEQAYEPTQPSTKNSSNFHGALTKKEGLKKHSVPKPQMVKSQKIVKETRSTKDTGGLVQKQRNFLANTNGTQIARKNRNRKFEKEDSSQQSQTQKSLKTPNSLQKGYKHKNNLTKTQLAQKMKSSMERKRQVDKSKARAKLNPWRSNVKDEQTDGSQLQISKHEQRSVESAQTTLFKTKNNLVSKFNQSKNRGFDRKSDHYSDSQYVELSQKFSTLTDGKFFKNQLAMNNLGQNRHDQHNDEIEENIEMETNSIYSASHKKQQYSPDNRIRNQQIAQSICDSLEKRQSPSKVAHKQTSDFQFRNSHYGFGQNLMKKFMGQVERPYSPPLGEREGTEDDPTLNRKQEGGSGEKEEVELIYDPVLNCYYDHRTHTYYELKN